MSDSIVLKIFLVLLKSALIIGVAAFLRIIPDNLSEPELWIALLMVAGAFGINELEKKL